MGTFALEPEDLDVVYQSLRIWTFVYQSRAAKPPPEPQDLWVGGPRDPGFYSQGLTSGQTGRAAYCEAARGGLAWQGPLQRSGQPVARQQPRC